MSELYDIFRRHPCISTDTRRIEPGSVFFALHGATFDGNRFAADALSKGAAYAVVDDPAAVIGDRTVLVGDTLEALQEPGARTPPRTGDSDSGHFGQQRQDHDQGAW